MMGWPVARKCAVAWRLGDWSQHPTWPHVRQMRKWTHGEPILRHSSQPLALGVTRWIEPVWVQVSSAIVGSGRCRDPSGRRGAEIGMQRGDDLRPLAHRSGDALDGNRANIADGK